MDSEIKREYNSFMPNEKILYQNETKINKRDSDIVPKDIIEKEAVINFLKKIPLEDLKKLVSFSEINPDDKIQWENYDLQDKLKQLVYENCYLIKMRVKI